MTTVNLTKKDLLAAVEVAKTTVPCTGSLMELDDGGRQASYCVMGCVIQGFAKNRHMGFDKAEKKLGGLYGVVQSVSQSCGLDYNDSDELVSRNDGFHNMGALKNWQIAKLKKLADKIQ